MPAFWEDIVVWGFDCVLIEVVWQGDDEEGGRERAIIWRGG